jgi:hypothetical protein
MIRYDLVCDQDHEFDGWFRDSAAYDTQRKRGQVSCSQCGSINVSKQIMAPGIPTKANRKTVATVPMAAGPMDPRAAAMLEMMRAVRREVESTAENVGSQFAEEARKIHYKETEERGIYGQASMDEAKALVEEGISVMPLPRLPEDGN